MRAVLSICPITAELTPADSNAAQLSGYPLLQGPALHTFLGTPGPSLSILPDGPGPEVRTIFKVLTKVDLALARCCGVQ